MTREKLYIHEDLVWKYGRAMFEDIDLQDVKWCFLDDGYYLLSPTAEAKITVSDMGDYYLYDDDEDGMYIKQSDLSIC